MTTAMGIADYEPKRAASMIPDLGGHADDSPYKDDENPSIRDLFRFKDSMRVEANIPEPKSRTLKIIVPNDEPLDKEDW